MKTYSKGCCGVLAIGMLAAGTQAHAASAFDPNGDYMFGDWGGARSNLADQGVTFNLKYISESAYNLDGGYRHDHTARYADQWTAGVNFDLDKLAGIPDAQFQITLTDRNGDNLTNDRLVNPNDGAISSVQEVYGRGNVVRLTQFWFKQKLDDGRFSYKLGRIPVGDDFAVYNSEFQNLYLGSGEPGNQNGGIWYNWPVSQWAAVGRWNPTDQYYAQLGVFNLNPQNTDPDRHLDIYHDDGTTGTLIPAEIGWTPKLGSEGLPGAYRLGGYYSTADATDYSADPADESTNDERYGLYYVIDQQVTARDGNINRGLSVFSLGGWNDDDSSYIQRYISGGLTYKGPFDARPQDEIGWGLAYAKVNDDYNDYQRAVARAGNTPLPSQGEEYDTELYYSIHLANWFKLRPNLQYVVHPGGNSDTDNAWVAGASVLATF
ncbi:carbohydrate porin [Kushneria phosphatilytica]|nr:carbohydrate porin [Kushneria phosphatilytica]